VKIYKTQRQVEKDIKDGVLAIKGDVKFECSISIDASIVVTTGGIDARNITAWKITAGNITALDIYALNIDAGDITAGDIDAWDITAWNITAEDIDARNIDAGNITAGDIDAGNILYYAVCFAYNNIKCLSIKAKRRNARHFCLDGEITIKKEEPKEIIKIGDRIYDKNDVEEALKNIKSIT